VMMTLPEALIGSLLSRWWVVGTHSGLLLSVLRARREPPGPAR